MLLALYITLPLYSNIFSSVSLGMGVKCVYIHTHKHTRDNKHCAEYRRNQTQLNENLAMILMNILIFFLPSIYVELFVCSF